MSFHLRAALVALAVILLAPATAGAIPPDGPIDPCDRPRPPKYCNPDPPPPADRTPIGHLDQVAIKNGRLHIAGWSIDPDTTGSIKVQILVDGKHRQTVDASISRPDVAAAHPGYGDAHRFDVALDPPLRHTRVRVRAEHQRGRERSTRLRAGEVRLLGAQRQHAGHRLHVGPVARALGSHRPVGVIQGARRFGPSGTRRSET